MSESPQSPTSDWATHERLKQLVPERVGKWKLLGTGPEDRRIDGVRPSGVLAEFRHGKRIVKVRVGQRAFGPVPVLSAPVQQRDAAGSETAYNEGGSMVTETHRVADGRTEVHLSRADGVTVKAHSFGVPASELKAIVMGFKAAPR
jgi:hypothetical protein